MKTVKVRYFAVLRELSGKDSETIEVSCHTYGELYSELAARYGFSLPMNVIQVAVNDEFSSLDRSLEHAARVVFIPPVSGG